MSKTLLKLAVLSIALLVLIDAASLNRAEKAAPEEEATVPEAEESQNQRSKRSGISDQRLAELEEMLRVEMIRAAMQPQPQVAYGLFDPAKIGRRRRRSILPVDGAYESSLNSINSDNNLQSQHRYGDVSYVYDPLAHKLRQDKLDHDLDQFIRFLLHKQNLQRTRIQRRRMTLNHRPKLHSIQSNDDERYAYVRPWKYLNTV